VARARTVAGYAIPGIVVFFFWLVVVILVIILLAFIVHWAGGGVLNLRLGHFVLNVGFTYPATTAVGPATRVAGPTHVHRWQPGIYRNVM